MLRSFPGAPGLGFSAGWFLAAGDLETEGSSPFGQVLRNYAAAVGQYDPLSNGQTQTAASLSPAREGLEEILQQVGRNPPSRVTYFHAQ